MIALAIVAVLATAVTLTFARPLRRAKAAEAAGQLRSFDAASRDFARRFARPTEIAFDLSANAIERREGRDRDAAFRARVPDPIRIESVWTRRRRVDVGEVALPVSPLGLSETYAVKLAGPDGARWLLFTGLGGQAITLTDDAQVQAILDRAASARRDAD